MIDRETLEAALRRAAIWLPHQGPLSVFIHHNTLESFEDLPFQEALDRAARALGARVRLTEAEYREMLADGRIHPDDLDAAFGAERIDPTDTGDGAPSEEAVARILLRDGFVERHWRVRAFQVAEGQPDTVVAELGAAARARLRDDTRRWFARDAAGAIRLLTGTDRPALARRRLREQQALADEADAFTICMRDDRRAAEIGLSLMRGLARAALPHEPHPPPEPVDPDALHRDVDEALLPVVSALLDLGQARLRPAATDDLFAVGKQALLRRGRLGPAVAPLLRQDAVGTLNAVLDALGVGPEGIDELLGGVLGVRPGWAGAIAFREHHGHGGPSLLDYVALRLAATVARGRVDGADPRRAFTRSSGRRRGNSSRADRLARLLVMLGYGPTEAAALPPEAWPRMEALLDRYAEPWRCRVLQEAREATHRRAWLAALASTAPAPAAPRRAQVWCCIDDREESFRRALEEIGGDDVETFGLAGHFQLTLRWRGVDDVRASARHPVLLASSHRVEERPLAPPTALRRWVGRAALTVDAATLDPAGGAVGAWLAGLPALARAVARGGFPRATEAVARRLQGRWLPAPPSRLVALREDDPGELPLGFSAEEAADRVRGALEQIGLTRDFAPLIVVLGHQSTSRNNPFASAYECGACGGSPGGGNARAFATLANDPEVRRLLRQRGVDLPDGVRFVGGVHDTATDAVELWPDASVPAAELEWLRDLLARAGDQDAWERSRRFLSVPEGRVSDRADVGARAADLSEVRPEYCHATNGLFVVGPRASTRGLFLDRRALLHSHDPEVDPDGAVLGRILGAAVPVCAGINLEYYFSRVDNERFGAGTKLPHNVVGLHGLMNGSLGDLRTGLPLQTVEIHEPTRLLVVVYAPRERVAATVARLPQVRRLVDHRWVQLAAIDADGAWHRDGDHWVASGGLDRPLPRAEGSPGLFRGRHDPLPPARVAR